ncbi:MAG: hypothetical protein J6Y69_03610 [Treponema sp.]|nr:hypothetical protein [Treponema sp.]
MKSFRKYISAAILFASASFAFSATEVNIFALNPEAEETVTNGLNDFAKEIMVAAPEAATQMNVWQEAHIGNLFPSIHPHFGGGLSIGGTAINMTGFKTAAVEVANQFNTISAAMLGDTIDPVIFEKIPEKFVLPSASLDLRLGGFVMPFDIGIFVIMTNPNIFAVHLNDPSSIYNMSQAINFKFLGFDGSIDYFSIGGDFRIRLLEEDGAVPAVSVGAGYAYTKGNIKAHAQNESEILSTTQTTTIDMGMGYQTQVIFIQGQVSKDLSIVSLFAGARGILSNTTCDWSWAFQTDNDTVDALDFYDNDNNGSVTATGLSDTHKNGKWDFSGIQPQVFAGLGFNLPKTQLTFSVCADVRSFFDKGNYTDFIWSGAFGLHFKI